MTDPERREKVIRGIEYCLLRSQEKVRCGDCPYWYDDYESGCHIYDMMRDALDLLREQEAKPPIINENSYGWKFYYCPSCKKEFYQNHKFRFCEKCGQEVRWDD